MNGISHGRAVLGLAVLCALLPTDATARDPLRIVVGIPPLAEITERIGGAHTAIHVLLDADSDPHTFEPTPRQIIQLIDTDIFVMVGMPFEQRLVEKIRAVHRDLVLVDAAAGIVKRRMSSQHHHDHHHEIEDEDRQHPEVTAHADPHIWLSPPLIRKLAANIKAALASADSAHASDYDENLARYLPEIDSVHVRIAERLAPYKGRAFYVFHPAFGHFGDTYGLRQVAVEIEGKAPTPRQLSRLIAQAKAAGVQIIFVQRQFDPRSAEAVAAGIGGVVVPIDPLARDVLRNLEELAEKIETALRR